MTVKMESVRRIQLGREDLASGRLQGVEEAWRILDESFVRVVDQNVGTLVITRRG